MNIREGSLVRGIHGASAGGAGRPRHLGRIRLEAARHVAELLQRQLASTAEADGPPHAHRIQAALDHGIVPSLSVDVETNMTPDLFSQMRAVFTLQRALAHERSLDGDKNAPQPLTCRQVLEMATMAGARCPHLDKKVGSLSPGKEADIIMLSTDAINVFPMNNAPGAVVTMMDTSNVKHVMIAGTIKKWNGKLVGANLDDLRRKAEASRDALMSRIRGVFPAYVPSLFDSCCVPTKPAPAAR